MFMLFRVENMIQAISAIAKEIFQRMQRMKKVYLIAYIFHTMWFYSKMKPSTYI